MIPFAPPLPSHVPSPLRSPDCARIVALRGIRFDAVPQPRRATPLDRASRLRAARRRARVHRRAGRASTAFDARDARALVRGRRATSRRSSRRCSGRCSSRRSGTSTRRRSCRRRASTAASRSGATHARRSRAPKPSYGVPAEIIVAIIGVETFYGRNTGSYRVIDALATLAFDYPRRARVLSRRAEASSCCWRATQGILAARRRRARSPARWACRSSCRAAIARFAVDFDGDGHIDLWHERRPTSIGSVANYLARHDWQRGQPVLVPATIVARRSATRRCAGSTAASASGARWRRGRPTASPPSALPSIRCRGPGRRCCCSRRRRRDGDDARAYWIACPNFYVITRYNKSRLYAAAVWCAGARR